MALVLFHGDKGGTGKSTVCKAFVDWALTNGIPVHTIDADTRNPDVHRMFSGFSPAEQVNLRTEDGWAEMVDRMVEMGESRNIAVNLPAGIGDEDERRSEIFLEAAQQADIPIVLFWVINRGVDSVNQLRHQLENGLASGLRHMICVRNQHFAKEGERFDIWDDSKTRQMFEEIGGQTADFPALSDRVVSVLDKNNLPYSKAFADGIFGGWDSMTLKKWNTAKSEMFESLTLPLVGIEEMKSAPLKSA